MDPVGRRRLYINENKIKYTNVARKTMYFVKSQQANTWYGRVKSFKYLKVNINQRDDIYDMRLRSGSANRRRFMAKRKFQHQTATVKSNKTYLVATDLRNTTLCVLERFDRRQKIIDQSLQCLKEIL